MHRDPLLLAAVAALARRRYIARAVQTTGQLRGHERKVGERLGRGHRSRALPARLSRSRAACRIEFEGKASELHSDWKLGDLIFRGLWNGQKP